MNYKNRLTQLHLLPLMMEFEIADILFLVRSLKYPSHHFNIHKFIQFSNHTTRSSFFMKLISSRDVIRGTTYNYTHLEIQIGYQYSHNQGASGRRASMAGRCVCVLCMGVCVCLVCFGVYTQRRTLVVSGVARKPPLVRKAGVAYARNRVLRCQIIILASTV